MIPAAAVEAACAAFYNDPSGLTSWARATKVSPEMARRYRTAMARALEAAAPHMLAECWDQAIEAHKAWTWDDENIDPLTNPYRPAP